jgi:hypothetical protein
LFLCGFLEVCVFVSGLWAADYGVWRTGMEEDPYLRLIRRGLDGLDIDQFRSKVCDVSAGGEMVTE